jgi:hypothetical protein
MPPGESDCGGFPCIFPADQGSRPRDELAPDSPHRHSVCWCRDFARKFRHRPRKSCDSARFWPSSSGAPEPETAGSGRRRRSSPRFSLLASWAVRIRFRFAPVASMVANSTATTNLVVGSQRDQSSTTKSLNLRKSFTFAVTTIRSLTLAIAATCPSAAEGGRPRLLRRARSRACQAAASWS